MRALLDTDIVLDLILDRAPFADAATTLWEEHRNGRLQAYVSPITPVSVFCIVRKIMGAEVANNAVRLILDGLDVCPLDAAALRLALGLPLNDFEDAVQVAAALSAQLDVIATRNSQDFVGAPVSVLSPLDLIARLSA
jgi:predicted nucleic acid-binding protein